MDISTVPSRRFSLAGKPTATTERRQISFKAGRKKWGSSTLLDAIFCKAQVWHLPQWPRRECSLAVSQATAGQRPRRMEHLRIIPVSPWTLTWWLLDQGRRASRRQCRRRNSVRRPCCSKKARKQGVMGDSPKACSPSIRKCSTTSVWAMV